MKLKEACYEIWLNFLRGFCLGRMAWGIERSKKKAVRVATRTV
jgi:hypothetical protein